jgi:hypothetical protein
MRRLVRFVGVPLAALAGGVAGAAPVFVAGLAVSVFVVGPLALLAGSLLAALSAGWVANLLYSGAPVRTRSRLWAIFGVSLLAAAVAVALGFAAAGVVDALRIGPNLATDLAVYLPGAVVFTVATSFATWRLRAPVDGGLDRTGVMALALSAAWLVFLVFVGGLLIGFVPEGFAVGLPALALLGVGGVAVAVSGAFLAAQSGVQGNVMSRDAALSLGLVGLAPVVILATGYMWCSVSYCGP